MARKNTVIPISSFDPRLKDLLLQGTTKRIELPCTSKRQRVTLRNQLMDYRAAARREGLEGAEGLYRAKMSFGQPSEDEKIWPLIIAPRGSEFDDVLGGKKIESAVPTHAVSDILADLPVEEEKK